ncbi:hypothetical protein M1523_00675 [Patescibacteria group bacterium]|nr:hypothetical protein [Patescibacteria group bacterium]MCL5091641.1 hypothetical protein [Patescibacteria group bacterium]
MEGLTQRQVDILKAIINEYTHSGGPVGSEILEKKYKLGVSPATIRNEMVELAKKGFLKKNHFSSGRVPSARGLRFYIKNIMKEKEMSTADEVAYKNSIWDEKSETHRLLSQATKVLANRTGLMSVAATNIGDVYYSGLVNLFNRTSFANWDFSRLLLGRLDETTYWERLLVRLHGLDDDIFYMLGEEDVSDPIYDVCASIFGEFEGKKVKGIIGVVGPKQMYYDVVSPQVKYFSGLIETILKEQGR